MQEVCEGEAQELIGKLVPGMVERIVAQRLRESVKEQGGLIHKDLLAVHADIAQLRQGGPPPEYCLRLSVLTSSGMLLHAMQHRQ